METTKKLWGGRFTGETDSVMEKFNASISVDKIMWKEDIKGSQVYAEGLEKINLLTPEECKQIHDGLTRVAAEWQSGTFITQPSDEDIHTANERRLKELIGVVAGKLHTGRSRNDQVATDTRLWLKKEVDSIKILLKEMLTVFIDRAADEINILLPGYTHLQKAQPIRWSHWLLSHVWSFKDDFERLEELSRRTNRLPLGCGALAGNPFGIDREFMADALQCEGVIQNSLFGTSDRDFVIEFLFWSSLLTTHFSKWAEDLIIYNTKEFQFVSLSDSYTTGSSLMPQKKNPDSLELIRGKCGKLFGNMAGFMMTVKSLPSAYNKDLQEDKAPLFDSVQSVKDIIQIATGTMKTLTLNVDNCFNALSPDMLATDVAYYLVRKGVPFREAHSLAGNVVQLSDRKKISIKELSLDDMRSVSTFFQEDVVNIWDYTASVEQYSSTGGTSKTAVSHQIKSLQVWIVGK